jgi:hypothetical protein
LRRRGPSPAESEHEIRYAARKEGTSIQEVKQTVKEVGNSRKKVEDRLAK